jgi:RNA polymerase sigma factor (sigma-70 family)
MLTENIEFDEIYEEYKNLVLKAAYTYSGNYDVAEDITQSTFLQLYVYYDTMNHSNVKSWLYTTAKNHALNYKKKANREVLSDGMSEENFIPDTAESAEDELLRDMKDLDCSELHGRIFVSLLEKNSRWYDAILLVYYLEIPQAKVAEEMGIRIEVLHSMLHRAKNWIKKTFGVEYDELNRL